MKVVLYMAQTPNGIIARENGDEDFLSDENWLTFCKFAEDFGCFMVGSKTYEAVQKWEDYTFDNVNATKIIISADKKLKIKKGYVLANSPEDALFKASSLGFSEVLLTGGGTINSAFMRRSLVDEIILNVEPFVLGKGIKIFREENFEFKLKLKDVKKLKSGIIQLRYSVIK